MLRQCRELVDEWEPDIIHIHGTENPFGLLSISEKLPCSVVISLQGLLGPYSQWYHFFGKSGIADIVCMHRWLELPAMRGLWADFWKIKRMAAREKRIIAGNHFFIGRTAWDRAYVNSINPSASYFHGGELLRRHFWNKCWKLSEAKRNKIVFTNAGHPRKGAEVLLDAV